MKTKSLLLLVAIASVLLVIPGALTLTPGGDCVDSDGRDYAVKGYLLAYGTYDYYDACWDDGYQAHECSGDGCTLTEYYCTDYGYMTSESVDCIAEGYAGCSYGACTKDVIDGGGDAADPCSDPAIHCYNGVQDCGEGNVDCGGAYCISCPETDLTIEKGENDPGDHNWNTEYSGDNVMMQLKVTGSIGIVLREITIKTGGTGNDLTDITDVKLVLDENHDGAYGLADSLLDHTAPDEDNFKHTFKTNIEFLTGDPAYLLLVYEMNADLPALETYNIKVQSGTGEVDATHEKIEATLIGSLINVKAVYSYESEYDHCYNLVQDEDEEGVDCGGAYCPECGCAPDEGGGHPYCYDGEYICDALMERYYTCVGGYWIGVPELYEEYCECPRDICVPGDFLCNYVREYVSFCDEGHWEEPDYDEALFENYCEWDEDDRDWEDWCVPGEFWCDPVTGEAHICEEARGPIPVPVALVAWDPAEDVDCSVCEDGRYQCNNEDDTVSFCAGGVWGAFTPVDYGRFCGADPAIGHDPALEEEGADASGGPHGGTNWLTRTVATGGKVYANGTIVKDTVSTGEAEEEDGLPVSWWWLIALLGMAAAIGGYYYYYKNYYKKGKKFMDLFR